MPALPAGITLATIGFSGPSTSVLGIVVEEGTYPVYGSPASNGALLQNRVAVGGSYLSVSASGR